MFRRKFLLAAILAATAMLAAPAVSQAAFLLKLESGSGSATLDLLTLTSGSGGSGGTGADAYSYGYFDRTEDNGVIGGNFNTLRFGNYTISADVNSTNVPGTQTGGYLTLTSLSVKRDASGTSADDLKISLTATDYTLPTPQKLLQSAYNAGAVTSSSLIGGTVTMQSLYSDSNEEFGGIGNSFQTTLSGSAQSANKDTVLSGGTGKYSITNVVEVLDLKQGATFNNASLTSTVIAPAPSGIVMFAGAVPFLGLLRRRLRKTAATA